MSEFLHKYGDQYSAPTDVLPKETSANLRIIQATREKLRIRSREMIVFAQPIISSLGQGCIFPNTINVIQGRKGVHKSRLTENISAVLLNKVLDQERIGFRQTSYGRFSLLYADSERNQNDQFPAAIQRIKLSSGYQQVDDVPNLDFISLIDINRAERFNALEEYLMHFRQSHEGHLVIVLDVLTDCVENFNDPRETMKMIDLMNVMVNNQDVTFICVIHENPGGGDKARGHLGTEVVNKASQVIQIGFEKDGKGNDTDLIRLKFLHSRNTRTLEPVYLRYSDEARNLVMADATFVREQQDKRITKGAPAEVKEWLRENLTKALAKEELIDLLTTAFECGKRTLEDRLAELTKEGFLHRDTRDRKAYYKLAAE